MLNKLFFSKKAHRILTALFLISFLAYGKLIMMAMTMDYTTTDTFTAGLGLIAAYYYDGCYLLYFVIRFIWRIFNKPDISQYEIDKRTMPREKFMRKYGCYRPGMFDE